LTLPMHRTEFAGPTRRRVAVGTEIALATSELALSLLRYGEVLELVSDDRVAGRAVSSGENFHWRALRLVLSLAVWTPYESYRATVVFCASANESDDLSHVASLRAEHGPRAFRVVWIVGEGEVAEVAGLTGPAAAREGERRVHVAAGGR